MWQKVCKGKKEEGDILKATANIQARDGGGLDQGGGESGEKCEILDIF